MKILITAASLLLASAGTMAQMTPVGTWTSLDDKTGETKSQIQITEAGGVVSGRI